MSFPGCQYFSQFVELLEEFSAVHATPLGEDSWKREPGISWTQSYVPFSFVDFNVYPFSVTIIASLNSASPPSEL